MSTTRRATIYLDPEVHRALRLRAAATDQSISEMVNVAVKQAFAEDAKDFEAFDERRSEKSIEFEEFLKALKRRGKL